MPSREQPGHEQRQRLYPVYIPKEAVMNNQYYGGKTLVKTLGSLLTLGALILGMTAPALSQPSGGQSPPTIAQSDGGQSQTTPASPNLNQLVTQFTFKNIRKYSDCVEDLLRLYQDKESFGQQGRQSDCIPDVFKSAAKNGLSKQQALEIIKAADNYATLRLYPQLFPPRGQRIRIAQMFGFIYKIDANDEAIRNFANQGSSGGGK